MNSAFKTWVGRSVVLQIILGDCKVSLHGKLVKDGDETVRMRIRGGREVDIYKVIILAVEEAPRFMPTASHEFSFSVTETETADEEKTLVSRTKSGHRFEASRLNKFTRELNSRNIMLDSRSSH